MRISGSKVLSKENLKSTGKTKKITKIDDFIFEDFEDEQGINQKELKKIKTKKVFHITELHESEKE